MCSQIGLFAQPSSLHAASLSTLSLADWLHQCLAHRAPVAEAAAFVAEDLPSEDVQTRAELAAGFCDRHSRIEGH